MILKHLLPVRVILGDCGDLYDGWPSLCSSEEADVTLIHPDGFKQEYWGDLSRKDAVALANFIADSLNKQA